MSCGLSGNMFRRGCASKWYSSSTSAFLHKTACPLRLLGAMPRNWINRAIRTALPADSRPRNVAWPLHRPCGPYAVLKTKLACLPRLPTPPKAVAVTWLTPDIARWHPFSCQQHLHCSRQLQNCYVQTHGGVIERWCNSQCKHIQLYIKIPVLWNMRAMSGTRVWTACEN